MQRKKIFNVVHSINLIRNELLPLYCYGCGKPLDIKEKEKEQFMQGNIHKSCLISRRRLLYQLQKRRMLELLKNPNTRKVIEQLDQKIIKKYGKTKPL